jgi:hypothetical protein
LLYNVGWLRILQLRMLVHINTAASRKIETGHTFSNYIFHQSKITLFRLHALAGFQGGLEDQRCIPGEATEFFRNQDDGISPERGDSPASRGRKHRPQGESLLATGARDVSGDLRRGLGVRADGGSAGRSSVDGGDRARGQAGPEDMQKAPVTLCKETPILDRD